jgi:hypothetical protein
MMIFHISVLHGDAKYEREKNGKVKGNGVPDRDLWGSSGNLLQEKWQGN